MIKNIHIFGATSLTGEYFVKLVQKKLKNTKVFYYSRNKKKCSFLDLNEKIYKIKKPYEDHIIINVAPIWVFSEFIKEAYKSDPFIKRKLKAIITCSSSSIITKKYSSNNFDKKLFKNLEKSEEDLKNICKNNDIFLSIVRPTLIYGKSFSNLDKNINFIIKFLRKTPIILFPKYSGKRQPIHASQLSEVLFNITYKIKKNNFPKFFTLNIGGDEEISYLNMIRLCLDKLNKKDLAKRTLIIKVPNKIFFFIFSPLILISPKNFEALLRINSNLSGFTKVSTFNSVKEKKFPVQPY